MSKRRASIFQESDNEVLDVSGFAPKGGIDAKAPPVEQVRAVTEAAQFRSREAAAPKMDTQFKRATRRYRTGRNVQFNVKALKETVDAVYAVSEAKGWVLGYTLQRAIEALQRELKSKP
jgi:ribosomal protein S12 methylthiotransferase accessory factor YcaO